MATPEVTTKVLEIGFGKNPALFEGSLFHQPGVHYTGVELPRSYRRSFLRGYEGKLPFPHSTADAAALPFADTSFDYVRMRSIFGQFDARSDEAENVRLGLYESFRVLKELGRIVIAEENTPEDSDHLQLELMEAGFRIQACLDMPGSWDTVPRDDVWRQSRAEFYAGKPTQSAPSNWLGVPSLIIARKPKNVMLLAIEQSVVTNVYENSDERRKRILPYKVPSGNYIDG